MKLANICSNKTETESRENNDKWLTRGDRNLSPAGRSEEWGFGWLTRVKFTCLQEVGIGCWSRTQWEPRKKGLLHPPHDTIIGTHKLLLLFSAILNPSQDLGSGKSKVRKIWSLPDCREEAKEEISGREENPRLILADILLLLTQAHACSVF